MTSSAKLLLYPGSFDPFTRGHGEIVKAATCLGKVIIGIGENSAKNYLFSPRERVELARQTLLEMGLSQTQFRVETFTGLTANWAREHGVDAIVKGVRSAADFESEAIQAEINRSLDAPPTVLVPAAAAYMAVSSSIVKELAALGGDCRWMLGEHAHRELLARIGERNKNVS